MKIDANGAYVEEIDKMLRDKSKKSLQEAAEHAYGSFEALTIAQFESCTSGDFSPVLREITGSWLQVYWLRGFNDSVKRFVKTLEVLTPKMDADEQRAADGLMQSTLIESLLVFTRAYFGLGSFRAAEQITIGEVLMAKKASYNEAVFRKKYSRIQLEKAKSKRK